MDWMKVGAAILLVMMIFFIFPRAKEMIKNSPKGSNSDWMGFLIPVVIIGLFIFMLVKMV